MMSDSHHEQPSEYQTPGMEFSRYLAIIKRHWSFILVFTLASVVSALALTFALSERYMAGAAIFYHPTEMSILRQKETEAFGAPVPMAPFKVIGQTLRDALKSEAILRQVVEELGLSSQSAVTDRELRFRNRKGVWSPSNYDREFSGPMTLEESLQRSKNAVAVQLLDLVV